MPNDRTETETESKYTDQMVLPDSLFRSRSVNLFHQFVDFLVQAFFRLVFELLQLQLVVFFFPLVPLRDGPFQWFSSKRCLTDNFKPVR
jgi:hypothetical protein